MRGSPRTTSGRSTGAVGEFGVRVRVVDDAQAVAQRVDELAVDVAAPTVVDVGRGLHRSDEELESLAPSVGAEVVETGAFARRCDESIDVVGVLANRCRNHVRGLYTTVENKC